MVCAWARAGRRDGEMGAGGVYAAARRDEWVLLGSRVY